MKNISYSDVLVMPTYERRYFLGLLTKEHVKKQEYLEEQREKATTNGTKGSRTTRVTGNALKSKIKSGDLPME